MNSWFGLIVFFIMFVAPLLANAWKKMQEKAEEKQAYERSLRQREQVLRTGRTEEPPYRTPQKPAPAAQPRPSRPSLEELAAQRQAQLRELRKR